MKIFTATDTDSFSAAESGSRQRWSSIHSELSQTAVPQEEHAFTLAELVVVLGMFALLGLLLLPAMAGAADRSQRARCQDNLRRIALGVTMYAGNNGGRVFAARSAAGTYVQIALNPPEAAAATGVGLTFETNGVWTCPNRPRLPFYDAAVSQWTIGYQYFGGIRQWMNPVGTFPSSSPTNMNIAQPHWALAADAVLKVDGAWGGGSSAWYSNLPPHTAESSLLPQGGNEAFVDGSVQWIQVEKMFFLSSWNSSARLAYWYQDPKDFSGSLKSALPILRFAP